MPLSGGALAHYPQSLGFHPQDQGKKAQTAIEMGKETPLFSSLRPWLSFLSSLGMASSVGLADCLSLVPAN